MMNNGFIKIVMILVQGLIGHYAGIYRPVLVDIIGVIGYYVICATVVLVIMNLLGVFKKGIC